MTKRLHTHTHTHIPKYSLNPEPHIFASPVIPGFSLITLWTNTPSYNSISTFLDSFQRLFLSSYNITTPRYKYHRLTTNRQPGASGTLVNLSRVTIRGSMRPRVSRCCLRRLRYCFRAPTSTSSPSSSSIRLAKISFQYIELAPRYISVNEYAWSISTNILSQIFKVLRSIRSISCQDFEWVNILARFRFLLFLFE